MWMCEQKKRFFVSLSHRDEPIVPFTNHSPILRGTPQPLRSNRDFDFAIRIDESQTSFWQIWRKPKLMEKWRPLNDKRQLSSASSTHSIVTHVFWLSYEKRHHLFSIFSCCEVKISTEIRRHAEIKARQENFPHQNRTQRIAMEESNCRRHSQLCTKVSTHIPIFGAQYAK